MIVTKVNVQPSHKPLAACYKLPECLDEDIWQTLDVFILMGCKNLGLQPGKSISNQSFQLESSISQIHQKPSHYLF
jgi:hypothetical protein